MEDEQQSKTIRLGLLFMGLVAVVLSAWYVYKLEQPKPGNCAVLKAQNPSSKWNDDCSAVQEISYDSTIASPPNELYLTSFTSSPSLGPAWGTNVWYSYRYVNMDTGAYGPLSPWTKSPIYAGSDTLPCKGGTCSGSFKSSGRDSCKSNLPTLEVDTLFYPLGSKYYVNIHRYFSSESTPPPKGNTGSVVGMLIQTTNTSGKFIDVSSNPCTSGSCKKLNGC